MPRLAEHAWGILDIPASRWGAVSPKPQFRRALEAGASPLPVRPALVGTRGHAQHPIPRQHVTGAPCACMQAYQTMRKGNKKFAVFDLTVKLAWEGHWLEGDVKVRPIATGPRWLVVF